MAVLDYPDFVAALPRTGALIGVDPGTKTLGLAASDPTRLIASPIETIKRVKFTNDAARLWTVFDGRMSVGIVIGHPLNMDGTVGPRAQSAATFARTLSGLRPDVPITLWDERLSTAAVERQMIEADVSRRTRAAVIDAHAAAFILQGFIDRMRA